MSDLDDRSYVLDQHMRITVLTRAGETDGRHDLVRGFAGPGMTTALHTHSRYEERLFMLDGELTVWAGAERVVLGPGDFYTIRRNVPHMLQAGPSGADTLNISSPAAFAELVERTATPARLAGPDTVLDLELFMRVTAELGDTVLGPPGTTPGSLGTGAAEAIHAAGPPVAGPPA
jgi:quercetin dioxygenase-like cupin family protein